MPNSLTYFQVDGAWRDVEEHIPDISGIAPQVNDVSAYVDFFPGTADDADQGGLTLYVPDYETYGDTQLSLAPITARTINAMLCTIAQGDPQGVQLVANAPWMALGEDLYYHVRFKNVTYGGATQRLSRFAFKAPTDATGVRLTSPTLQRYPYRGP